MKQLITRLIDLIASNADTPAVQRFEPARVRVAVRSPLESRSRRAARSRASGQGWRVTSISGF
jgi:hypothetical protein